MSATRFIVYGSEKETNVMAKIKYNKRGSTFIFKRMNFISKMFSNNL